MRARVHHHPCQQCGAKTECGGVYEQNYDGFPEVICPEFHRADGTINFDFVCERCSETPENEDWPLLASALQGCE